jgi:hypothetical protein
VRRDRRIALFEGQGGASSAPVVLIPTRVSAGTGTLADADGGAPIAPTGDAWPAYRVESWVSADDAVGEPRPFDAVSGLPIGSCYGLPATARNAGFDAVNASNIALWDTLAGTLPITIRVRFRSPGTTWPGTAHLVAWQNDPAQWVLRIISTSTIRWRIGASDLTLTLPSPGTEQLFDSFITLDSATPTRVHRLYAGGALSSSANTTLAVPAIADLAALRTREGPGHVVQLVEAWDTALTDSQMDNVVAGTGPAPLTSVTGLVSGIVNPSDATQLAIQDTGSTGDITAQAAP